MIILDHVYSKDEIMTINAFPNGFVKGVVDIEKELVALDADMHYQLADFLKQSCKSREQATEVITKWIHL